MYQSYGLVAFQNTSYGATEQDRRLSRVDPIEGLRGRPPRMARAGTWPLPRPQPPTKLSVATQLDTRRYTTEALYHASDSITFFKAGIF